MELRELLDSDEEIDLVVQGGGMRGAYSNGVLSELNRLGYNKRFREIWGTSAGSLNAAYFITGQSDIGLDVYSKHLTNKTFINYKRIRKMLDVDYMIDVLKEKTGFRVADLHAAETGLNIGVLSASSGREHWFHTKTMTTCVFEALRATAAMPIAYGREVHIEDDAYVDGALIHSLPVQPALAKGAKNVLAVLTRPIEYRPKYSRREQRIFQSLARIQKHSPGVIQNFKPFDSLFSESMDLVRAGRGPDGQRIYAIAPSEKIISRMTRVPERIDDTVRVARKDVSVALA